MERAGKARGNHVTPPAEDSPIESHLDHYRLHRLLKHRGDFYRFSSGNLPPRRYVTGFRTACPTMTWQTLAAEIEEIMIEPDHATLEAGTETLSRSEKVAAYKDAMAQLESLLAEERHVILKMATINCVLRTALPHYFWVGFYLVHEGELVVGPYQGTLGCLHISFDRGVCGAAARTGEVQLVPDVQRFPGHIACDSNSRSEICVPVRDPYGSLTAVFDVDSADLNSFDDIDELFLTRIMERHFGH